MHDLASVFLVVMGNTIKYQNYKMILNIFDLKGSKVNREVPYSKSLKNTSTLKDLNFLRTNYQIDFSWVAGDCTDTIANENKINVLLDLALLLSKCTDNLCLLPKAAIVKLGDICNLSWKPRASDL